MLLLAFPYEAVRNPNLPSLCMYHLSFSALVMIVHPLPIVISLLYKVAKRTQSICISSPHKDDNTPTSWVLYIRCGHRRRWASRREKHKYLVSFICERGICKQISLLVPNSIRPLLWIDLPRNASSPGWSGLLQHSIENLKLSDERSISILISLRPQNGLT